VVLSLFLVVGLAIAPASAATQLSGINFISARGAGPTRIVLTIPGGAPAGSAPSPTP